MESSGSYSFIFSLGDYKGLAFEMLERLPAAVEAIKYGQFFVTVSVCV